MKVLLLGASGMLGQAIKNVFDQKGNVEIIGADLFNSDYNVDLTNDNQLNSLLEDIRADVIINSAAIVNLAYCEVNKAEAYLVNGRMPGVVADSCRKYGTYLIQISTDHFFKGDGRKKHDENAAVNLFNEYARSKYIGESFVKNYENSIIVRTNIVGFRGLKDKKTFIEWALDTIESGKELTLYDDFYTSSMHTLDLANILFDVVKIRPTGLMNIASSEVNSKEEFVCELSKQCLGMIPQYSTGSVNDDSDIVRGDSLGLDVSFAEGVLGYRFPDLEETIFSIKNIYK